VTTTAVIEAQHRVLQALETAIYGLGPWTPLPVELTQTADPRTVSETIELRQGRRRLVPLRALRDLDLRPRPPAARPVEVTHSGAVPDVVSETISLRQRRRRLVPLDDEHQVHANHGSPPPPR
jgi:hypothetical protein